MTSIELIIEQITLEYKKYLPDWEFPNKEQWIDLHKKELKNAWYDSTMQFDAYAEMTNKKSFDDYYQETFKKD
jgi:hypothetical protein